MRKMLAISLAAGAALGLALPAARAATIFDINFNADTGDHPATAAAADAPPANTNPSSLQSSSYVLIKTATPTYFTGFGDGQFAVVDVDQKSAGLFLTPHAADQVARGILDFKVDFQIDGDVSGATGSFGFPFWAAQNVVGGNVVITQLQIDVTNGAISFQHQTGTGNVTEDATTIASLDAAHTLQAILTLNGGNSSIIYKLDGTALENSSGTSEFAVGELGTGNQFQQLIVHSSSKMTGRVALDNITLDISSLPEPAGLSVLMLGGVWLMRRRR